MAKNVRIAITADTKGLERGTARAGRDLHRLGGQADRANKSMSSSAKRLGGIAAGVVSVGSAVATLKESVSTLETAAKGTAMLARTTGMSTEESSRWVEVAKVRNVQAKQLNMGFVTLSKSMKAGADGGKAQVDMFKKLGVSQKELKAQNMEKTLATISDAFAKMPDGAQKSTAAQKLFGRQQATLLPLLNKGSTALREQLRLSDLYGTTLDKNQVKQAGEAAAAQRELTMAWDGVKISLATKVVPALRDATRWLADTIKNIREGKSSLSPFVSALGTAAKGIAKVTNTVPGLKTALVGILVLGGMAKMLRVTAAISGVSTLATMVKRLKGSAAGTRFVDSLVGAMPGRIRQKQGTVTAEMRTLGRKAGTGAGTSAASSMAASMATTTPSVLSRKKGKMATAFTGLGRALGAAAGVALAIEMVKELQDLIPKSDELQTDPRSLNSGGNKSVIEAWVDKNVPQAIRDPGTAFGNLFKRKGGLIPRMAAGGVLAHVSPGEMAVDPSGRAALIPGRPVAADSVLARFQPGTAILTGHGQSLMAGGASLGQALAHQLPHFKAGGRIGKVPTGSWMRTGATVFTDKMGYKGRIHGPAYAELSRGVTGGGTTAGNATSLGGLRYGQRLAFKMPGSKKFAVASKQDIGDGQGGEDNYTVDLWSRLADLMNVDRHSFKGQVMIRAVPKRMKMGLHNMKDYGRLLAMAGVNNAGEVATWGATGLGVSSDERGDPGRGKRGGGSPGNEDRYLSQDLTAAQRRRLTGGLVRGSYQSALAGGDWFGDILTGFAGAPGMRTNPAWKAASTATPSTPTSPRPTSNPTKGMLKLPSFLGAGKIQHPVLRRRLSAMVKEAAGINKHHYAYQWAGGHGAPGSPTGGPGPGYDCSGAVSAVLHRAGYKGMPKTSGGFMGWHASGEGKVVTLYTGPNHVFMKLGNRYFGTSGQNPGGGAGWFSRFPGMPSGGVTRHPRGLRRGGVVGGANTQFVSGTFGRGRGGQTGPARGVINRGGLVPAQLAMEIVSRAGGLGTWSKGAISRWKPQLALLRGYAKTMSVSQLLSIRSRARARMNALTKGGIKPNEQAPVNRLGAIISLVHGSGGARLKGLLDRNEVLDDDLGDLERDFNDEVRARGLEEGSPAYVALRDQYLATRKVIQRQQRSNLTEALGVAKAFGQPTTEYREGLEELNSGIRNTQYDRRDNKVTTPEKDDTAEQLVELLKEMTGNQQKLIQLTETQGPQLMGAIIAAVNGGIGGRVGLGFQSPGFATGVARL